MKRFELDQKHHFCLEFVGLKWEFVFAPIRNNGSRKECPCQNNEIELEMVLLTDLNFFKFTAAVQDQFEGIRKVTRDTNQQHQPLST